MKLVLNDQIQTRKILIFQYSWSAAAIAAEVFNILANGIGVLWDKEHTRVRVSSLQFSSDMSRPQIKSAVETEFVSGIKHGTVLSNCCHHVFSFLRQCVPSESSAGWGEESVDYLLQNVSSYSLCCRSKGLAQRRDKSLRWKIKSSILPWYRMVYLGTLAWKMLVCSVCTCACAINIVL